jgi:hypothetical protein
MRGIFILNGYGHKMKHIIWSERCLVDIVYLPISNGGEPGSSVERGSIPGIGERIFPLASVSRPALAGGPFSGVKAQSGRDADHSPPSSAEVENEQELYLLFPQAHPRRVVGRL